MKGRTEGRSVTVNAEVKAALTAWLVARPRKGTVSPETYFFPEERPQSAATPWADEVSPMG
jgi:hypothetical protein